MHYPHYPHYAHDAHDAHYAHRLGRLMTGVEWSAPDAVVIGAGQNGLVAANLLADAGRRVLVLEGADRPGGAVRSDEKLYPGFVTDWFSAFFPLAAASPVFKRLELERWGLAWRHAPAVLGHVFPDGRCAVLSRDVSETAASLDTFAPGDGAGWVRLVEEFRRIQQPMLEAILGPFPPVRALARLVTRMGLAETMRFLRFALQPVRRFGDETFSGEGAPMLLAGNALHTDLAPEAPGSAVYGWLLCMLGQTVGFPVPAGGSGVIIDALINRLQAHGGQLRTGAAVARVHVTRGRVHGVQLASGERIATRAVLADVDAPRLYRDLVGARELPERLQRDLDRFHWDSPTLKVNWALAQPIPWTAPVLHGCGTVHLGVDLGGLTFYAASLAARRLPPEPFVLLGQMTTADPARSPVGTESAWAYTHLPEDMDLTPDDIEVQVGRIEAAVERHAPGFSASILARAVQAPNDLERVNANLFGGALGGGTSGIHQQLVFRPVPGLGRAETTIDGLYLASASAHPGGGVHGAPGANAAAAVLRREGRAGRLHRTVIDTAYRRIYR